MEQTRYSLLQRVLHWVIALLVFAMLTSGLSFMVFGDEGVASLVQVHMTFGVIVLLLMLIRVALRKLLPTPAYDPPLTGIEALVGKGIHLLLYILLIGLPIGGLLATSAAGETIQFFNIILPSLIAPNPELAKMLFSFHGLGGITVLVLVLVHTAAAIKHWRILKDNMMNRISLP